MVHEYIGTSVRNNRTFLGRIIVIGCIIADNRVDQFQLCVAWCAIAFRVLAVHKDTGAFRRGTVIDDAVTDFVTHHIDTVLRG